MQDHRNFSLNSDPKRLPHSAWCFEPQHVGDRFREIGRLEHRQRAEAICAREGRRLIELGILHIRIGQRAFALVPPVETLVGRRKGATRRMKRALRGSSLWPTMVMCVGSWLSSASASRTPGSERGDRGWRLRSDSGRRARPGRDNSARRNTDAAGWRSASLAPVRRAAWMSWQTRQSRPRAAPRF